ncbi:MAG TPA: hypothetical protein VLL73_01445 [Desulfurivibrionaceae bacterium]|nr:hypothetical protein [Desulfurivibrionaceae bacterium]
MTTPEKRTIHRPTRRPLVALLLALAAAIGVAAWWLLLRPAAIPPPPAAPPVASAPQPEPPAAAPESGPETDQTSAPAITATTPKPASPPSAQTARPNAPAASSECQQIQAEMQQFFGQLDREDYIVPRRLPGGSEAHIGRLLDKLFANPPVLVGETNTFLTVLSNTAHFYRILKKDDVLLIKDILLNESENLEPVMALFYRWSLKAQECGGPTAISLPLPGLYEYAGFFLNTLGGRSYLFRRESRLRLLVKYYSILVLDRANGQRINTHGIDVRPALDSLNEEMRATQRLKNRATYLTTLTELQAKYRLPPGAAKTAALPR